MREGAIVIAWGAPKTGREILAVELFNETKTFYDMLQKRGDITSFDPFLLSLTGDQLRGFFVLKGDPVKLMNLMMREDFMKLSTKASQILHNVVITPAYVGDGVTQAIDLYKTTAKSLELQHV